MPLPRSRLLPQSPHWTRLQNVFETRYFETKERNNANTNQSNHNQKNRPGSFGTPGTATTVGSVASFRPARISSNRCQETARGRREGWNACEQSAQHAREATRNSDQGTAC